MTSKVFWICTFSRLKTFKNEIYAEIDYDLKKAFAENEIEVDETKELKDVRKALARVPR